MRESQKKKLVSSVIILWRFWPINQASGVMRAREEREMRERKELRDWARRIISTRE